MGALLVACTVAVVLGDAQLGRYPFLFLLLLLALAWMACLELLHLLAGPGRPWAWLCYAGVALVVLANLPAHLGGRLESLDRDAWHWVLGAFTAVVLAAFLVGMATFREPGTSVMRIALTIWTVGYLALLPSFLAQLRWPVGIGEEQFGEAGTLRLALAIFVPKCGDIGAYFTGRLVGRHPMAPVLSPKKTWEGAAGGLAASVAGAIGIDRIASAPVLHGLWAEVGFGVTVGIAGMLGDLAESLIKRDCRQKDASHVVPGFGGVLDVVDSVVFAAPVAYCWLR
ncbi:MAG TPA: phosphatidate cytidylyltransferase [Gemmataceae bacterium]|jgi:phosphatidate cytidylyltransferase|nr:phosphatidate cytidylyltransferase [Gemmataceae bacterium]